MSKIIVMGTGNKHKLSEIKPLLEGLDIELKAAGEYGPFDPIEDGETLEANAIIKANAAMELTGEWAMADDTGLEVDALDGRPGIYAARYAGEQCSFDDNINKMLAEMKSVPAENRGAQFICCIALCRPGEKPLTVRGVCAGKILTERRGNEGFGYDPIFYIEDQKKSLAELSKAEKNQISHRSIAVRAMKAKLAELL